MDALTIVNDLITRVEGNVNWLTLDLKHAHVWSFNKISNNFTVRSRTPQIYNMKGIVAALNSFHMTALEAFTTALELARSNQAFNISEPELKQILLNRIVMLVKLQRFEEAVEAFSTIKDLDRIGFAVGALATSKCK